MNRLPASSQPEKARPQLAEMAGLAVVALLSILLYLSGISQIGFPFVFKDIAWVYWFAALPLASIIVSYIPRKGRELDLIRGGLLVATSLLLTGSAILDSDVPLPWGIGWALRVSLALTLGCGAVLLGRTVPTSTPPVVRAPGGGGLFLVFALLFMTMVPAIYLQARSRHALRQLDGLLEQSRLGEAERLARALRLLNVDSPDRPLDITVYELESTLEDLRKQVRRPLPSSDKPLEVISRARIWAILGERETALEQLDRYPRLQKTPELALLRGTIEETLENWTEAESAFRTAHAGWKLRDDSPEKLAGLYQATRGIAFAQRKSGAFQSAETTYRELLELSPTAETHFLVARFYEDMQKSSAAQRHAQEAMTLDPQRYGRPGEELIKTLSSLHFGCWGVFREQASAEP